MIQHQNQNHQNVQSQPISHQIQPIQQVINQPIQSMNPSLHQPQVHFSTLNQNQTDRKISGRNIRIVPLTPPAPHG